VSGDYERVRSRYLDVGGIRTHYLDAGDGPPVVLLHSGEFGGSAELCWEFNIGPLARDFRVIAPDWLGFGGTDKLRDFVAGSDRMIRHMSAFLAAMAIDRADFAGALPLLEKQRRVWLSRALRRVHPGHEWVDALG